jgi:hypothetical protein
MSRLVGLVRKRNEIDGKIASVIGCPAEKDHVGKFLASCLFDIEIESSATEAGFDGRFRSGSLTDCTVNIKWYAKWEGLLDIKPGRLADF